MLSYCMRSKTSELAWPKYSTCPYKVHVGGKIGFRTIFLYQKHISNIYHIDIFDISEY